MANVLSAPTLAKSRGGHRGQAEEIVQLAISEQAAVRGDPRTVEFQLDPAVEGDPKRRSFASPVASAILGSLRRLYRSEISTRSGTQGHQDAAASGKCGLKLCGPGEWLVEKHGSRMRRSWKKLHLATDADTGRIVASALTGHDGR